LNADSPKEIAVSNALTEIYNVLGRRLENGEATVKAWLRWIPNIPVDYIQKSFDLAMSMGGRAMVPTPKNVKDAYGTLKKDENWTTRTDAVAHSAQWYQDAIAKGSRDYPEFSTIFSTINVNDSRPLDGRNEEDRYFMKIFNLLYTKRFGGKMANKFDIDGAIGSQR